MGGSISTYQRSKTPMNDANVSFSDFLKSACIKIVKNKKRNNNSNQSKLTLEDWLLSSPEIDRSSSPAVHASRNSPKVCPLSVIGSYIPLSCTPRDSFSIDDSGILRKSKSKNKVSFKLPEEADIHLYHDHDDESELTQTNAEDDGSMKYESVLLP